MRIPRLLAIAAALWAGFATPRSGAQTGLTRLYNFTPSNGANPGGIVAGPNGVLYGATAYGGNGAFPGEGTVFALQPPATPASPWAQTVLYAFTSGRVAFPTVTPVVGPNGVLYGTTGYGGNGSGTVYELQPPASPGGAWTETVLYTFPGSTNAFGGFATSLVLGPGGVLYGTTYSGGDFGQGLVFRLTPPAPGSGGAWSERDLYSFTGTSDGSGPEALVITAKGAIYGATYGGGTWGAGAIFEITPPTAPAQDWKETVLYSFTGGADGSNPWQSSLTASDGVLYGTTFYGGASDAGTVFQLQPPPEAGGAWTETVLYNFGKGHGYGPNSPLIVSDGDIYGTTSLMYTGDPILGSSGAGGIVFLLQKPATPGGPWTELILHQFLNDDIPYGSLFLDKAGVLYGTALDSNGPPGDGFVYKITR